MWVTTEKLHFLTTFEAVVNHENFCVLQKQLLASRQMHREAKWRTSWKINRGKVFKIFPKLVYLIKVGLRLPYFSFFKNVYNSIRAYGQSLAASGMDIWIHQLQKTGRNRKEGHTRILPRSKTICVSIRIPIPFPHYFFRQSESTRSLTYARARTTDRSAIYWIRCWT